MLSSALSPLNRWDAPKISQCRAKFRCSEIEEPSQFDGHYILRKIDQINRYRVDFELLQDILQLTCIHRVGHVVLKYERRSNTVDSCVSGGVWRRNK